MDGRAYVEAHIDEVVRMTGAVVMRRVMPTVRSLPPFVRNDPIITAEDLIWGAVGEIWARATYYRPEETALSTWVYTCVPRYCESRVYRKALREQRTPPGHRLCYLDKRIRVKGEDQDETLGDLISTNENIEDECVERDLIAKIVKAIDELDDEPAKDAVVGNLVKGETLNAIGKRRGVSGEAIRQQRDKGIRIIRKKLGIVDM